MEVVFIVFIRLFILSARLIDIAKFGSDFIPIYVRCVSPMTVTARCGEKNCSVYHYWKAILIFLVWIYWAINLHFVKRMRGNIREMSSSKPNLHRSGRGIFSFSFSCSFHVSFLWIINLSSHITLSSRFFTPSIILLFRNRDHNQMNEWHIEEYDIQKFERMNEHWLISKLHFNFMLFILLSFLCPFLSDGFLYHHAKFACCRLPKFFPIINKRK